MQKLKFKRKNMLEELVEELDKDFNDAIKVKVNKYGVEIIFNKGKTFSSSELEAIKEKIGKKFNVTVEDINDEDLPPHEKKKRGIQ